MSLLKTKTSFAQRSQSILDVFNKTVNGLSSINAEITAKSAENDAKIAELAKDNAELGTLFAKNETIVSKLTELVS